MIEKVNNFPLEKIYFLESQEFLEKKENIFLKNNKTFKLNSYWLGFSKQKFNNDKMIYLFNGLRGYYEVRSRFLKKPEIMEIKAPLAKAIYYNDYLLKKRWYPDLLIYSLKKFNRPTITLKKDSGNNIYYSFPYKLIDYLNHQREILNTKENYNFWKKEYSSDLRYIDIKLKGKSKRRKNIKLQNLRFFKLKASFVLGYFDNIINNRMKQQQFLLRNNNKIIKAVRLMNKKNKKEIIVLRDLNRKLEPSALPYKSGEILLSNLEKSITDFSAYKKEYKKKVRRYLRYKKKLKKKRKSKLRKYGSLAKRRRRKRKWRRYLRFYKTSRIINLFFIGVKRFLKNGLKKKSLLSSRALKNKAYKRFNNGNLKLADSTRNKLKTLFSLTKKKKKKKSNYRHKTKKKLTSFIKK